MSIFQNIYQKVISRLERDLPEWLYYHNADHTRYVMDKTIFIAEKEQVTKEELSLLKLAALYHDTGFLVKRDGHEEISCRIASEELIDYEVTKENIAKICQIIRATRIPQRPNSKLECILADADLEYLGTDLFFDFSEKLYQEVLHYEQISKKRWNEIQVEFISNHKYHTTFCKRYREPQKMLNLECVKRKIIH